MHDEFIHPNWHVILIHLPLGLLGVGVVIELLSFLWRRSGVSRGRVLDDPNWRTRVPAQRYQRHLCLP
jgi:hypothetical protein